MSTVSRFRSRHYPSKSNRLVLSQQFAMQYYAVLTIFVMMGVLVMLASGSSGMSVLLFGVIGEAIAIGLGNIMASVRLKNSYAEVFFVGEHFSVISVDDILRDNRQHVFPLHYANPTRTEDRISLHYHDQIISLKREDWEDFDLIWGWLNN